jgi:hypothetical protein
MRQVFEMTQQDLDKLLEAMRPQPMILLQCGSLLNFQERANAAWAALGARMGFDHMTVKPHGQGARFFTAEPRAKT